MQKQHRALADQRREIRRLRAERDAARDDVQAFAAIGLEANDEHAEATRDLQRLDGELEKAENRLREATAP
jgi:hypothetical protein